MPRDSNVDEKSLHSANVITLRLLHSQPPTTSDHGQTTLTTAKTRMASEHGVYRTIAQHLYGATLGHMSYS